MGHLGRGLIVAATLGLGGCADLSVKITGSSRSGSEQLLLTGTSDRIIDCLDFRPMVGPKVFLDASHVKAEDSDWLIFSLRRAMARQGVLLVDDRKDAQVVVEAAVGAYGTDEVDCRLAMPGGTSIALFPFMSSGSGSSTPYSLSRKSYQDAVVKLALTAFDAASHRLIWETGTILRTEHLDRRFLGTHETRRSTTLPVLDGYPRR